MPLLDVRVWRFGLAYYFVFGAFVALALWLPKYYVGQYGLPLATAAFLTILFDLPSGAIRALGGWASDKWGGNTVTWWVMWVSLACMFLLSYPPTTMIVHAIKGDVAVDIGVGVTLFTVLIFIVGLAQGFGKASVYRSLADHYPTQHGRGRRHRRRHRRPGRVHAADHVRHRRRRDRRAQQLLHADDRS